MKTQRKRLVGNVLATALACSVVGWAACGKQEPVKEYTDEEKLLYKPTSLTVTLYDAATSTYGFTYNTDNAPVEPVLQIQEGSELTKTCKEYPVAVTEEVSYDKEGKAFAYYVSKAAAILQDSTTYTYRVYDKTVGVGTEAVTFTTRELGASCFRFAHVSDSQTSGQDAWGSGSGKAFGKTLSQIVDGNDFILHTGDFVEWSKYEAYWDAMLDGNFQYLSKIPVMAISGNHETEYRNGRNETFKHFHYKLPDQASTERGLYYSFVYGNTKFLMLNASRSVALEQAQYEWLENELKNNTCRWTVVAMHQPMYSAGKYGADPNRNSSALDRREQLVGLFANYGVDIVLQGHDHLVSRTYPINERGEIAEENVETVDGVEYSVDPRGVIYVMNGPAGDQTRSVYDGISEEEAGYYKYKKASRESSWAEIEIDGDRLTMTVKYYNGTSMPTYTKWGIKKT